MSSAPRIPGDDRIPWNSSPEEGSFRQVLEVSPDSLSIMAAVRDEADGAIVDFTFEYVNPVGAAMQGTTVEAMKGQSLLGRHPGSVESGLFAAYVRAVEIGESYDEEVPYHYEGYNAWYRIAVVKHGDGVLVTASDVSRRRRAQEHTQALLAIATRLSGAVTPEQVADVVFEDGCRATEADGGTLTILRQNAGTREFETIRTSGFEPAVTEKYHFFPLEAGRPSSDAVLGRRSIFLESASDWEREYGDLASLRAQLGYEALACIPVIAGDHALGTVTYNYRGAKKFDSDRRIFLETLGRLCAQALERSRAFESALRERERNQSILESVQDGFIAVDSDFRYTFLNSRALAMMGKAPEEIIGRRPWEVFPGSENGPFVPMMKQVLAERETLRHEAFSAPLKSWLEVSCYPAADGGMTLFFHDTSERHRAQDSAEFLAEASRSLASSLDYEGTLQRLAHAAVPRLADWCAVDMIEDPDYTEWPPAVKRLAAVHQDPVKIALAAEMSARYPTNWNEPAGVAQVLRTGKAAFIPAVTTEMFEAVARDQGHLDLLRKLDFHAVIIVPLIARGKTLGALTLITSESGRHYDEKDLALASELAQRASIAVDNAGLFRDAENAYASERAAREESENARRIAEDASRTKSQFLAVMSHELRTPLNAIGGYAELLEIGVHGEMTDAQLDAIRRLKRSQQHLLAVIDDLLSFAKLETGKLEYRFTNVPLNETLAELEALVTPQLNAKGLKYDYCALDPAVTVWADRDKLEQIVINLLTNAIKFTRAGLIEVKCDVLLDVVQIRVRDTGVGMAEDKLSLIFDPFVQLNAGLTRTSTGSGLGLAISRDLARGMRGDIEVESEEGKGSTFTVTMPRRPP